MARSVSFVAMTLLDEREGGRPPDERLFTAAESPTVTRRGEVVVEHSPAQPKKLQLGVVGVLFLPPPQSGHEVVPYKSVRIW